MKGYCRFLKVTHHTQANSCATGLNFASVGSERALCLICPLADLGEASLCPNAEVYTVLRNSSGRALMEVEFACLAYTLLPEARCQGCPERSRSPEHSSGLRIPTLG